MSSKLKRCFCIRSLIILLLISPVSLLAQNYDISGKVTDKTTGQAVEFASVYLLGTDAGGYTDGDGKFHFTSAVAGDTLIISEVGHIAIRVRLDKQHTNNLEISLAQNASQLNEVSIVADRDAGAKFMKKVVAHKEQNNPDNIKNYSYKSYNRAELDINNFHFDSSKKSKLPQSMLEAMNRIDTANKRKGQLPVYFVETLSDQYHSTTGSQDNEVVTAQRSLGLETDKVFRKLDKYKFDVHIYDNWIPLFNKTFVSPVSDKGSDYYKYYISDSTVTDGHKVFLIQFVPQKHENAFRGFIKIADSSFAVVGLDMQLSKDANLNFVETLVITQDLNPIYVNGKVVYAPYKTSSTVTFQSGPDLIGIPVSGNSNMLYATLSAKKVFSSIVLSTDTPGANTGMIIKRNTLDNHEKDEAFWLLNRTDSLTLHEQAIYKMIDTIKENRRFQAVTKIAAFAGTGFWDFSDKWRVGPYSSFISLDKIEGVRLRAGFWSMEGTSKHWNLNGYLAYGTKDKKFKGGLGVKYLHSLDPWSKTSVYARSDYDVIIDYDDELDRDNIISSMLRKNIPSYRSYIKELKITHEEEIVKGLTNYTSVAYKEFTPVFNFQYTNADIDEPSDSAFSHTLPVTEINTNFRFARGQKFTILNYDRISLYSTRPIISLSYTYGFEMIRSEFEYHKISVGISQNLKLPPKATLYYHLAAGRTFGTVPYILLDVPKGNEFYVSSRYCFNTMAPYEFIADRYASIQTRLSLGGMLLDHVPYLEKLQWRERLSFNSFMGGLSDANKAFNASSGTYTTGKVPFAEAGVGIENIFHSLSVEYYWRLTHLDNKLATKHGVYVGVTLNF